MFYCESCRVTREWPKSFSMSFGNCEICGAVGSCYDVPSSKLPMPKNEEEVLDALRVIGLLQEKGFKTVSDGKAGTILERGAVRVAVYTHPADPKVEG